MSTTALRRCAWAGDERMHDYHDREWGVPVHDDRLLFEMLTLEGAQAGLSWATILKKRDRYREVFDGFDVRRVAGYTQRKVDALLGDPGIVRNRAKIAATIANARGVLRIVDACGSFDAYIWQFVGGSPRINRWKRMTDLPAQTDESRAMSRALLKQGFKFVGPTICYAFMQAVGMVNDHTTNCFRHRQV